MASKIITPANSKMTTASLGVMETVELRGEKNHKARTKKLKNRGRP